MAGGERPAALLGPCGCQSTQHRYCGETLRRRVLVIHLVLQFLNLVHRRLSLPRIRSMRQKWPERKTSLCNELELGETQIQASCEFWVGVQIQTLLSRKCFVCLCVCERREAAGDPLLALQVGIQPYKPVSRWPPTGFPIITPGFAPSQQKDKRAPPGGAGPEGEGGLLVAGLRLLQALPSTLPPPPVETDTRFKRRVSDGVSQTPPKYTSVKSTRLLGRRRTFFRRVEMWLQLDSCQKSLPKSVYQMATTAQERERELILHLPVFKKLQRKLQAWFSFRSASLPD